MFSAQLSFSRKDGPSPPILPMLPFSRPRAPVGKARKRPALAPSKSCGPFVFEESVYRGWNPDVEAAILAGTLESGSVHFAAFGRREQRPPYLVRPGRNAAARLRAGDELFQSVTPTADWWAAAAFVVRTHGGLARIVMDCDVHRQSSGDLVRSVHFDEWATDGEELVLKFAPLTDSAHVAYLIHLRIRTVDSRHTVQPVCEPSDNGDGLLLNGAPAAMVRMAFDLRYTPLTLPGPSGITLNPVTHCAGECIHCLSRSLRKSPARLQPAWLDALRQHFREGPGIAWCVDYATDFFKAARSRPELIELLVANGNTAINTEGHYVTESALRRLFSGKVRSIGFSADAATEQTYAIIRKGLGKLETVLASAELALRVRRELGLTTTPIVAMSMVVMKANVHEVVDFVELAAKTGVDAVWYNQLWVCSDDMVSQSMMFAPELWRSQLEAATSRGKELGIGVFTDIAIRPEHPQKGTSWCPEPWRSLVILGDGTVLACASPASTIGNLRDSTIEEIWNGQAFQELRRRVNSERLPLMCEHCPVYRKPGNADGVFLHHLIGGYDLRRDLLEEGYARAYPKKFSAADARVRLSAGWHG